MSLTLLIYGGFVIKDLKISLEESQKTRYPYADIMMFPPLFAVLWITWMSPKPNEANLAPDPSYGAVARTSQTNN
jgi:hypothetical protein